MKIVKSFLLIAFGFCTTNLLHAQELKAEIAKPVKSTVPPAGSKPALAPDLKPEAKLISNEQKPESEFKITDTKIVPTPEVKDEDIKPQIIISKNSNAASPSTLATDIKESNVRPILLPVKTMNNTTTPPVKNEIKKPVTAPVEQIQN